MSKVVLGIGLPGSGKTTILKEFAEKNEYSYLCPDDLREEVTGDPTDHTREKEVWDLVFERLQNRLESNDDVVLDFTMINKFNRDKMIAFLRENGVQKITGLFVDTPLEVAQERNLERAKKGGRKVPEEIIDKLKFFLDKDMPEIQEDFDSIFTLNEEGELKKVEKRSEIQEGEIHTKHFIK